MMQPLNPNLYQKDASIPTSNEAPLLPTKSLVSNTVQSAYTIGRSLESSLIVWLDDDEEMSNNDDALNKLGEMAQNVQRFTDPDTCIDYITDLEHERVYFILTSCFAESILLLIHQIRQIAFIYLFSQHHDKRQNTFAQNQKVKDEIFVDRQTLYDQLKKDRRRNERDLIILGVESGENDEQQTSDSTNNRNKQEATFMYSQLMREIFLEMKEDSKSEMIELLRKSYSTNPSQLRLIDEIEHDYRAENAINWYTRDTPLYKMVNKALRTQDARILYLMRTFLRDVHIQLDIEHQRHICESIGNNETIIELYRGQKMAVDEFDKLRKTDYGLLSISNFLSTTVNKELAIVFAGESNDDETAVLFEIEVNLNGMKTKASSSFANIEHLSQYGTEEQEWLFSMGSVFRIERIEFVSDCHLWSVKLKMTDEHDKQLNALTDYLRTTIYFGKVDLKFSFATLLYNMGVYNEAAEFYHMNLQTETDWNNRVAIFHSLGSVYNEMGLLEQAISQFQQALKLEQEHAETDDDPLYAKSIHGIATAYHKKGQNEQALIYMRRALAMESNKIQPDLNVLATQYNNIGMILAGQHQIDEALENYQQSLKISLEIMPPTHPTIAVIYNNMSSLYRDQGRYNEAEQTLKKALDIHLASLPPNHPDIAVAYNNMAILFEIQGRYDDALVYFNRRLHISSNNNHPSLAVSYINIGVIHNKQGRNVEALQMYQKALGIQLASLPNDHPDIGMCYLNIGVVLNELGLNDYALQSYEHATRILEICLPPTHPQLSRLYNNMSTVYNDQGQHDEALMMVRKAHDMRLASLSHDHPDIATSYNNVATTLYYLKRFDEAFDNVSKAVEISTRILGAQHPRTQEMMTSLQRIQRALLTTSSNKLVS